MAVIIIQTLAMFGVPLLILRCRERKLTKFFGPVAMAYVWGIVVGIAIWLLRKLNVNIALSADIAQIGSYACIGLAIPLLMFGTDFKELRRLTKKVLISFVLLIAAVAVTVVVLGKSPLADFNGGKEISAMAAGMYTGGTPNFNAIGVILKAAPQIIAWGNLSDMIVGSIFYVFILTAAKPILGKILDKRAGKDTYMRAGGKASNLDVMNWGGFNKRNVRNLLLALACTAIGGAIGFVVWKLKGGLLTDHLVPAVMITGTFLGLLLSFAPKVREVEENSTMGQYLILVFSFTLASSLDLSAFDKSFLQIVLLLGVISLTVFVLHGILSRFFRIDADCTIITMTAGIYGPAFIPAVTSQLKNDKLTAPGLICGAVGYAIGTFIGTGLFYLL